MGQGWEDVKSDMRRIVDCGLENLSPNVSYSHMIQDTLEAMIEAYELRWGPLRWNEEIIENTKLKEA